MRIPNGSPRMLLLNWLEPLVPVVVPVLLLALLFLANRDFSRLVRVLVVPLLESADATVVNASAALAVWSGVAMHTTAARSSAAMREDLAFLENDERECMVWLWFCRLFGAGAAFSDALM